MELGYTEMIIIDYIYYYYIRCLNQHYPKIHKYKGSYLVWTAGNGAPMHGVYIPYKIPTQEEEADTRIIVN